MGTIDPTAAIRHASPDFTSKYVACPRLVLPPAMFEISNVPSAMATVGAIIRTLSTFVYTSPPCEAYQLGAVNT